MDGSDGEVVGSIGLEGATVEVLPSDTVDPAEARARIDAERERLRAEIERARGKLVEQGLHGQGAAASWCRPSARSSSASRPSWPSWRVAASGAPRSIAARSARGGALSRLAGDVRHAVRARAHAAADDVARLAAGALSLDPRGGLQRQVVDGPHDRRAAAGARPCAPARTCRRTWCRFAERVEIGGRPVARSASRRRSRARPRPPRSSTARSSPGDRVTQFEALTAAAYWELARAGSRGGRRRGRPRRALRRDQRDPLLACRC